jgi:predicted Zn-dependent protease
VRSSRWLEVADRAISRDDGAERALAAARESLDAKPDDFVAALRVAQSLVLLKRGPEAITAAQRALSLEPHQVNALSALADAYLTAGDNARASEAASRGLEILDELPLALFVRIMADRGDPSKREDVARDRAALAQLALSPDRETQRVASILLVEENQRR